MGFKNVGVSSLSNFSKCPTFEKLGMMREVVNLIRFENRTYRSISGFFNEPLIYM